MSIIDRRYSVAEGQAIKSPCKVATTANITLSGAQTIDGVAVTGTSPPTRVLVKDQTDQTLNGIYDVSTGNWTRTKDFDGAFDILKGTAVYVTDGTINTRHTYLVTTAGSITIGTSLITFEQDRSSEAAASAVAAAASAVSAAASAEILAEAVAINYGSGGVLMYPPNGQLAGPWTVLDPYGHAVSTAGTTTDGLQEAINYAANNGFPLRVLGHGCTTVSQQTGTLHSSTTITGLSTAVLTAALANGLIYVTGAGIPPFTTISSVDSSSQIHISQAATASGAVSLRFVQNLVFLSCTTGIQFPPAEQWSASFEDVNITFSSAVTGPCFTIDSCMIVDIRFVGGQIVGQPSGAGLSSYLVYFNPVNPVPADGIVTITASRFFFSNLAYPASSGTAESVVGFNVNTGGITNNYFGFIECNGTGTGSIPNANYGIKVFGQTASNGFEQNIIEAAVIHIVKLAGVQNGVTATNANVLRQNIWRIGAIKAGASADGFNTFGSSDVIHIGGITSEEGAFANGVYLQSSAASNHVTVGQVIGQSGVALFESAAFSNYCYGALRSSSAGATKGHFTMPDGTIYQYINNAVGTTGGTTTTFDVAFVTLLSVVASPQNSVSGLQVSATGSSVTLTTSSGSCTAAVIAIGR
jgi:uncharacterized cupin superfamily protein